MSAAVFGGAQAARRPAGADAQGWLARAWLRFQRARLERALESFSDRQLAEIGVVRNKIAEHARTLVEDKA